MSWKQPIPTNLESVFGDDYASLLLYKELLYRSANKDGYFTDERKHTTWLERGQVWYSRRHFARFLCWDDVTCDRKLEKLQKTYHLLSLTRDKRKTVVTIINYESDVDMSQQVSLRRASGEPQVSHLASKTRMNSEDTDSKSVKSDKSVKKDLHGEKSPTHNTPLKEESKRSPVSKREFANFVTEYNVLTGQSRRPVWSLLDSYRTQRAVYSMEEMLEAVRIASKDEKFWGDKVNLGMVLNTKTDWIGDRLNSGVKVRSRSVDDEVKRTQEEMSKLKQGGNDD